MLTKRELLNTFEERGFRPLKRYGENYLIDKNIKDKIIVEAGIKAGDTVLEIGPGFGALTMDIAGSGARLYAVEKDRKACAILSEMLGSNFQNVKLVCEDILKFDMSSIEDISKIKVIGNLPYYITTPVIEYLIERRSRISGIIILVQREVANRMLAKSGSKEYSSFTCFVQYYTKPTYIHTVKRDSFYPVPEVDSSILRLDVLDKPSVSVRDEELFFKIIRGAFNQRRKSISNSISRDQVLDIDKSRLSEILASAGISPSARPEDLSLAQFALLANSI